MTNKTFRLFISSPFSDFNEERRLLQSYVFPKIKKHATSKGYTFQPIDLRWGVSNEAQLDQKTLELCLEEVRAFQEKIVEIAKEQYHINPVRWMDKYLSSVNDLSSALYSIGEDEEAYKLEMEALAIKTELD